MPPKVRINALPMRDEITPSERYDVSTKLPDGATSGQIPEVIQAMLRERFQLKAHREKRDLPANPPTPNGPSDLQASGTAAAVSVANSVLLVTS